MCVTVEEAVLSNTILLAHRIQHEGKTVNVLGYQNHAESLTGRPNAMVLPIPSAAPMGPENCIDMTGAEEVFRAYEEVLRPRTRSASVAVAAGTVVNHVQVFDTGSYTVLLTKQVSLKPLRDAMEALPEKKRLELNFSQTKVFSSFRKLYPGWHIAICIWEGNVKPEPLLWWYEPMAEFQDKHFLPGLDAHDGSPPDPGLQEVPIDHTLVVGAPKAAPSVYDNARSAVEKTPPHLRKWLPSNVFGHFFKSKTARNGDWVVPVNDWTHQNASVRLRDPRVAPPGYQV